MIPFTHIDQADAATTAVCTSCDWSGISTQCEHLAGEPICPNCKQASLNLVEDGEDAGVDL